MSAFRPVRFGKYLLLEKLATGGMAQLYKGKMTGVEGFEKLVAIKQILPHLAEEKDLVNAFIDEAKLAAMLHHQNIVQIYDFGNMEGTYYIAMEYLLGKDLRMIVKRAQEKNKPLHLEQSLFIISHMCAGLDYAHKMKDFQGRPLNIIHRDISPQNIIITYEGEVKILDFGIAKAATQSTMTQTGMIKGKVAYMSPEQAAGKTIDYRSDIFPTGILLYELITGRRMFTGDTLQILAKVRDVVFEPVESIINGLPTGIYNILNRALAKEPDQRYQSCGEMLSDIEACMFGPEKIKYNMLMPTASGLAQYMKELFEKDMETDLQVFRDTGEISMADESTTVKDIEHEVKAEAMPVERKPQDKIVAQPRLEAPIKEKRKMSIVYAAVAAVVVGVVLAFIFLPKDKQVSLPEKVTSNVTVQPPAPMPSDTPVLSKAPLPDSAKKSEPSPDLREKAKELLEQAPGLIETKPQKAKSMLIEVVKIDPQSVQGHFHLGMVFMKLQDYPKSIETFKKVAELNPQFPDVYFNLGYVYAINRNYPKAEEMYKQVVKLSPSYLDEALFNLGIVQEKQGKREQCIENIERAIKVNPENKQAIEYLAKLKRRS